MHDGRSMAERRPSRLDPVVADELVPSGIAILGADGTITAVNGPACTMLGRPHDAVIGRSVLDFVHPDDLAAAAELLRGGPSWEGSITGPAQVRYLDAEGRARTSSIWSRVCLEVEGIEGYVLTVCEESTSFLLSDAIRAIAARTPLVGVLEMVARSLGGHPNLADATIVHRSGDELVPIGTWPPGDTAWLTEPEDLPWSSVRRSEVALDVDVDVLPRPLCDRCRQHGIETVWCRTIGVGSSTDDLDRRPVLIVWRRRRGPPSPNQERSLAEVSEVIRLAVDQHDQRRALERAAYLDPVSGLGNRARFEQILDEYEVAQDGAAERPDDIAGVLYLDLDGFKEVNDRFGHDAGDQVLAHVASRLHRAVRANDEVVRVGGDEFVVLCRQPADLSAVEAVARRLIEVLARPVRVDEIAVPVGASVGVVWGGGHLSLRRRIALADHAMLSVKAAGKGGWQHAELSDDDRATAGPVIDAPDPLR